MTQEQWKHWKMYDKFVPPPNERFAARASRHAPWHIVEGEDERYRAYGRDRRIRDAIRKRARPSAAATVAAASRTAAPRSAQRGSARRSAHGASNASSRRSSSISTCRSAWTRSVSTRSSSEQQGRLNAAAGAQQRGVSTILVFEGWDAAGKGGAIRRVTGALDARDYQVIPIAAPTDEERAQHYLWRFWRHLSRAGAA